MRGRVAPATPNPSPPSRPEPEGRVQLAPPPRPLPGSPRPCPRPGGLSTPPACPRFLFTPQPPWLRTPPITQFLCHLPPGQPATTPVVSIFGDQAWAGGEGHLAPSEAPAHSVPQTCTPSWRSSTAATAEHSSSPANTPLSAQVSGQRSVWPPASPPACSGPWVSLSGLSSSAVQP